MAAAQKGITFEAIMKEIAAGQFRSVYLLMGNENYYIDRIADAIVDNALREDERDFCLNVFYGSDASVNNIINAAQSFPMMGERSVVLVREAQNLSGWDDLSYYLQHPQPSTVLVLVYKNGTIDRRKKVVSLISTLGVVFESAKVKDYQLPALIRAYAQEKGFAMDEKSVSLVADSIGCDLIRLYGEMDKLFLAMPAGQQRVTPDLVERNIGISKDFNYFELQNALVAKDVKKAFQIAKYFANNPKANPIQLILPTLFRFFSTLMIAHYAPDKTSVGIANYLGQPEWMVRNNVLPALRLYSAGKVLRILEEIRMADEKSKGMGGSGWTEGDILRQLLAFIME
ncbi:MAG: DNA polymerase III subunit delta [Bacteroidaceae bacterium]|nr:DNA polymerase III subunit delta [Bacteroidaceae bacterium]